MEAAGLTIPASRDEPGGLRRHRAHLSRLLIQQLPVDGGHVAAEADEGDLRSVWVFREKAAALGHRDGGGLLGRIVVDPCADGGAGHRAAAQLQRPGQGGAVAGGQQLLLPPSAPVPHGADCMDDVFGRKAVALRRLGLAGGTAVEGAALGQQLRTGCPVDGPVHSAAAQQGGVGGVDDGVHL